MMITIDIEFFDKETEFIADEIRLGVPDDMVFRAVETENPEESKNISYINARPFDVTDEIKAYVIEHHPETAEKFEAYLYEFIGRHGLGPEYD